MRPRILNLDDSLLAQDQFLDSHDPEIIDMRTWGPRVRLGCSWSRFRGFESALANALPIARAEPRLTFVGSGDFHHVSLALVRQIREPFVLLMLDNHPDWMAGVPFLHCGTWVHHASKLPNLEQIIHLGGDTDFDNGFTWLAPSRALREGKIVVAPARRQLTRGFWKHTPHQPLLDPASQRLTDDRLATLFATLKPLLRGRAVYVSLDKDVLQRQDAVVNWDSGYLRLPDVVAILAGIFERCQARLIGMDVVGDWSPVRTQGLLRRGLDWIEHPWERIDPDLAKRVNEQTNLSLMDALERFAVPSDTPRRDSVREKMPSL